MSVLQLADAKAHLNITSSTDDAEILSFIDVAEAAIVRKCGPLASTTMTERVPGYSDRLLLTVTPAISLTSVTPVGGTALTVGDLRVETSGVITYNLGLSGFSANHYDVIYQAGRAVVPADLLMGIKELVRRMWATQRPGEGNRFSSTARPVIPANWVEELLAPYLQVGF